MNSLISISMVLASTWASALPPNAIVSRHTPSNNYKSLSKPGYNPAWIETFDGAQGTLPSSQEWIFDLGSQYPGGAERWGNNEFQNYTASVSNIHITAKQTLQITPRRGRDGQWTSARIETQRSDFAAAKGGKLLIESKLKVGGAPKEQSQGIWPAFWALGSDFRGNYTNWPQASEWDFMEVVSGEMKMYSTIHCGFAPGGPCKEYAGIGNGGVSFNRGDWNYIGFEVDRTRGGLKNATWADESLNWYLNGKKVFTVTGKTVGDKSAWKKLAHDEHFLLLNVAVGGNWPGAPNNQTASGAEVGLEVDYIGVWNSM